jgi:squalene-hopene/tetraprenyl-beta-curcumene cyclase
MNNRISAGLSTVMLACATAAPLAAAQAAPVEPAGWDQAKAAQYLDDRIDLWFANARTLKTGEGKTSCTSCHMVVPYMLASPALRRAMQASDPTAQEVRLLKETTRRVETYPDHEPLSASRKAQGRPTEAVLNALILAREDAQRPQVSEVTRKAFRQLWETQRPDGAWDWTDFGMEPDESNDSHYYGAALAAMAVGTAAGVLGGYEPDTVRYLEKLRAYLNGQYAGANLYNRTWMLLASTRLTGLLNREQRQSLIGELKAKQNGDGGWSLYQMGPWRWSKTSPPFAPPGKLELSLLEKSDGYATGLVTYALRRAGVPADDPSLGRATEWLKANQKEVRVAQHIWKCWRTYSLNHDQEQGGSHGGEWQKMMMSDLATAFAVLALCPLD